MEEIKGMAYWVKWAGKKVLSRGPMYLPKRIGYAVRKKQVIITFPFAVKRGACAFKDDMPVGDENIQEYFRNRKSPRFHFDKEDIENIVSRVPADLQSETLNTADEIANLDFSFRGYPTVHMTQIKWDFSPEEDTCWRWDLNRHFFFMKLGFAWWYTGKEIYADTFFKLSSSWIEENLHNLHRLGWDHPFEVGARINAWIWAHFLFLHCPLWKPSEYVRFVKSIGHLSEYLYQSIEFHNPGNHILLEAKSLELCASLFPEFQSSEKWKKKASKILDKELEKQICRDGVHEERSTMYHRIITGELAELLLFRLKNPQYEGKDKLFNIVDKMSNFVDWIGGETLSYPLYGDAYQSDSYYRFSGPDIIRSLKGEDFTPRDDNTIWALGNVMPPYDYKWIDYKNKNARAFRYGGYFVSRSPGKTGSTLVWDCGPVGYHENRNHSHLDALSFTLSIEGTPFIIDPGTTEANLDQRRYLRGTASHNTVLVDSLDQSIIAARNDVWSPARTELEFWGSSDECDVMSGKHFGYLRLREPVEHSRTIINLRGHWWVVFDSIEGSGIHVCEQRFHVAPGNDVIFRNESSSHKGVITGNGGKLFVHFPLEKNDDTRRTQNNWIQVEAGIAELNFGIQEEINVINQAAKRPMPMKMAAIFLPGGINSGAESYMDSSEEGRGFHILKIIRGVHEDTIYFRKKTGAPGPLVDNWITDARVTVFRKTKGEPETTIILADYSLIAHGTEIIEEQGNYKAINTLKVES